MAFQPENFVRGGGEANSAAPVQFNYKSTDDDLATIKGSGYFDAAALPAGLGLKDGDMITVVDNADACSILYMDVTSANPPVASVTQANDFA